MFFALIALCILAATATADSKGELEQKLSNDYVGKNYWIRGFYDGNHLEYDATGTPVKVGQPLPWTVSLMHVKSLKVKGGSLDLEGERLAVNPARNDVQIFHQVSSGGGALRVRIQVSLAANPKLEDVQAVLQRVFVRQGEDLDPMLPEYWHDWMHNEVKDLKIADADTELRLPSGEIAFRAGSAITPPRPISTPDPQYYEAARLAKFQGTTVLWVVVDRTGHVAAIQISRPLGFGLDEQAVAAVKQWTFSPATKDGKPVAARINVEVNFKLR